MTTRDIDRIRFVTQHFNDLQGLRAAVPLGLLLLGSGVALFFEAWPVWLLQLAVAAGASLMLVRLRLYYRRTFGEVERQLVSGELSSLSVYSPAGPLPLAIERRPMKPAQRLLIPMILALALFLILRALLPSAILMTDGSGVDPWVQLHPPVVFIMETPQIPRSWPDLKPVLGQTMYVLCGAAFLGVWLWRGRRPSQSHYLVLGALLLGLAALGACLGLVLHWNQGVARAASYFLPGLALFSLAWILCGVSLMIVGLLDHWQIVRAFRPLMEEAS